MTSQNRHVTAVTLPVCAAILLAGAWFASAGDLNPPPGVVAPTMKTLSDVEPRIAINATNTPGDAGSLFKITQPGSYYVTGNITGAAGLIGIEIAADDVSLDLNGFALIGSAGGVDGIRVTSGRNRIVVRNGIVRTWGGIGVDLTGGVSGEGSVIEDVIVSGTTGYAIRGNISCVIARCTTIGGQTGITSGAGSSIRECTVREATDDGIVVGSASIVLNCIAQSNAVDGIAPASGSSVIGCTARENGADGIDVGADCIVRANCCAFNGTAGVAPGIRVSSTGSVIEGNLMNGNDFGIIVTGTNNLVRGNTAHSNTTTDLSIVAGNGAGPTVTTANVATNTSPNANFDL